MVVYFIIILVGVLLDQLIKWWAIQSLPSEQFKPLMSDWFGLIRVNNHGAAYNLLNGKMYFFYVITAIVVMILGYLLIKGKIRNRWFLTSLALLLAGTLGNALDRVFRGYVVDMFAVSIGSLSAFNFVCNFADILITVGVCLLLIYLIKTDADEL
ncbi:signal peptidase II [Bombilactobacillus folatiphilus]|uniref:Lipoprotein signal peptidase n=1 Tax=Bombilactobacillus folatiphilus TaxID=2923362 RepID=A0ABY4P723_9LACO|nr:signal peptidase II [Bombilactobacillus folatiphilus]UQS81473.1 signal peptidase II [Bombilactobacillus folatiphilus]